MILQLNKNSVYCMNCRRMHIRCTESVELEWACPDIFLLIAWIAESTLCKLHDERSYCCLMEFYRSKHFQLSKLFSKNGQHIENTLRSPWFKHFHFVITIQENLI